MDGLVLYSFAAAGLGAWLPGLPGGMPSLGARFLGGFALLIVLQFVVHAVLGMPLFQGAAAIMAIAAAGLCRAALRRPVFRQIVFHPVPLLLAIGAAAIVARGGIDYLPYTSDEFSNWLGASRHIFMAGDFTLVRDVVWLPGYTPGWRLALLFPWSLTGRIDEGASASAPFVMMIGLAGMLFDFIRWQFRDVAGLSGRLVSILAWLALLGGLVAELAGLAWIRTLLIEPPQIYTLAAFGLIIAVREVGGTNPQASAIGGLILAASYLIKSAALTAIPGLALVLLVEVLRSDEALLPALRRALWHSFLLLAPVMLAMALWTAFGPAKHMGIPSLLDTLQGAMLHSALAADWLDLARRFVGAVWEYVASYKMPLTALSMVAVCVAALRGRPAALLFWSGFFLVYMGGLYWYHLAALGEYYFGELNSIPRFTRVPLQVLHVVGFLAGLIEVSMLLGQRFRSWALLRWPGLPVLAGVGAVLLLGVETVKIGRSVEDVSTRRYQSTDPRIVESRQAVEIGIRLAERVPGSRPVVTLIAQGEDSEPINYAIYFARRPTVSGDIQVPLRFQGVSWTDAVPANVWQQKVDRASLRTDLLASELIWPMRLDPWIQTLLAELADPTSCGRIDESKFLIRESPSPEKPFICRAKSSG